MFTKLLSKADTFIHKLYRHLDSIDGRIHNGKMPKAVLFGLSLLFFGVLIFIFNRKTPFQWDDFKLAFVWVDTLLDANGEMASPTARISSFHDILVSQYNHYFTWGGRVVVHIIAQFLLFINPMTADILNTLAYLAYVVLIYFHIVGKGKHDVVLFIGVNILVWLLQPVFGETILWLTGSANYLWGTVFILAFLLPFRIYDAKKASKYTAFKCVGMLLLGIIAGWTNENTGAAAIFIAFAFLFFYRSQKWRIPMWVIVGCAGALIGYLIMISAPGNIARAELRTDGIPMDPFNLSYRFLTTTQLLFQYLGVLNLLGFILFVLYRRYSRDNKNYKHVSCLFSLYFVAALVAVYIMLFSPIFPPRAWFGAITFNTISFGVLFYNLKLSLPFMRQIRQAFFLLGVFLFGFTVYEGYRDVTEIDNMWKNREALIVKQQETGERAVLNYTYSRTKFALSDPPFLHYMIDLYYGVDVELK